MSSTRSKPNYFIYFSVLSTTLVTFATGTCFVWTSPVLIKFGNPNPTINPIGRVVTISEAAWIVSTMSVGLIFGPLFAIVCLKYFTKKTVLLIVAAPLVIAHLICTVASEVTFFLLARFLMGLGSGAVWNILGSYIAEISEDFNRGSLGALAGVMSNLGSLFVYVVGPYLKVWLFSIINLIPLICYYILFGFFVPESPYDMLLRNNEEKAKNSLVKLRQNLKTEKELAFIKETITNNAKDDFKVSHLFKNKGLFKALIICMGLMACQQLSGILAVVSNAQTIFELAGGSISSAVSTMIIGLCSTTSSITSCQLTDRMGRKKLITISCLFISLSLFSLGIYFYLQNIGMDVSMLSVLPIASLMVFMFSFNFGLAALPWVVMGEVLPSNAKRLASTLISSLNFNLSFLVTLCFPYMVKYLGMEFTFWIFGVIMVLGLIFCIVVLPETKGKNLQEILNMLQN